MRWMSLTSLTKCRYIVMESMTVMLMSTDESVHIQVNSQGFDES